MDDQQCKLKTDFILLSEFAEIRHGPQPILTIPDKGHGFFDISSFSVRVFSTDFQQSQEEEFSICPDVQVLLTEPADGAYAYVHYFALNDIQARGYLRQYCICYITSSPTKLVNNFQAVKDKFSKVTMFYKCGNHRVFSQDLDHRLADIEYSLKQIGLKSPEEVSKEYDSRVDDIPEYNRDVLSKEHDYIAGIMKVLSQEMSKKENQDVYFDIEKSALFDNLHSSPYTTGNSKFYAPQDIVDLPKQEVYKPKQVMSHVSHRFTRQLRSLAELSAGASSMAIAALKEIHKFYSRSEAVLSIESFELNYVSPVSSMLSAGRMPLSNMLSCKKPFDAEEFHHLLHTHSYSVTSSKDMENNCYTVVDNGAIESLDESFMDRNNLTDTPLYLEVVPRQRGLSIVDPLASPPTSGLLANKRSQSGLSCCSYATPETFPTPPPDSPKKKGTDEPDYESFKDADDQSLNDTGAVDNDTGQVDQEPTDFVSPLSNTASIGDKSSNSLFTFEEDAFSPNDLQRRGFPFLSSATIIEKFSKNKPGNLLLQYFKDLPELRDILYSILIGMPFVIIASPKDTRLVVNHIKALWLFVGGHSRKCQVIPWQETPLTTKQLSEVKLMGMSSNCYLHDNIKKHIAYWDWTTSSLVAPKYNGTLLNPILNRTREKKDSSIYLSLVVGVLADLAGKVFVYYHGFCCQPAHQLCLRQSKPPEVAPKKLHAVSPKKDKVNFLNNIRIKDSDIDIIEYWADIIRQQQLTEWQTHCSLSQNTESLNTIRLTMKYCSEKICKPKKVTAT